MLILDWMKTNVISVPPNTTLLQCRKLFKDNHISRLPVVDADKKVVGVVSTTDINAFAPQRTTGLEILEVLDLLAETPASQVMSANPVTINYKGTIDQAAQLMMEKRITCLPVVNSEGKLVGILTEWDIFKALVNISGAGMPAGVEMAFALENKPGTLREILGQLRGLGVRISTVLSLIADDGLRQVKIRFWSDDADAESNALSALKNHAALRYWGHKGEVYLRDRPDFKL